MSTVWASTSTLQGEPFNSSRPNVAIPRPHSTMPGDDGENTTFLPPSGGPQARPPGPKKFSHGVFDPEVTRFRKIYIKMVGMTLVLIIIMIWVCAPVYWGSLASTATNAPSLKTLVIDRDGGEIGQTVVQGLLATTQSNTRQRLGWRQIPADQVSDVGAAIIDEQAWGAVVVNSGASAQLAAARASGDSSYDPTSTVTFYYAQARNEQATGSYVVPITTAALTQILREYNDKSAGAYLSSISGNATALQALVSAPQTLNGVWWTTMNLRPFTAPVTTALTLVGQIYLCIFAFILTMTNAVARGIFGPFLELRSYLKLRLLVPLALYFPLSLAFAMVSLPFRAPFGTKYTYAGGFFLYFAYTYLSMAALGLATEAMITILEPRFMAFFLIPLIIINVSVTAMPFDLMPAFYQYGRAFPVFNSSQAVRTILFNTKDRLGLNAVVILAWCALSCVTIPLFTILKRRRDVRAHQETVKEPKGFGRGIA